MAYFKKIVGERCYLSPIDPDDAATVTAWVNDPEVAAGVTLTRRVLNVHAERDTLADLAGRPYHFSIVALEGEALIGICALDDVSAVDRTGEIEKCGFKQCGYWPDSWYHEGRLHGTVMMYLLRADFTAA